MPLSDYERRAIDEFEAEFKAASHVRRCRRRRLGLIATTVAVVGIAVALIALAADHVVPGALTSVACLVVGVLLGVRTVRVRQRWLLGAYSTPRRVAARGAVR
jgi:uncharacterized membrane protein